ncbi:MAG: beta-galactosidase trimerization domain-containing protein, partial [Oscillospiraceae bacterium]|nr:beta-galactosidase trimerization domain-containing protein [Oscillospiraceae bacterium]
QLAGIRILEIDPLYDHQHETLRITKSPFPLAESYRLERLCERVAAEGAEVLGVYETENPCIPDNIPCLTKHSYGRGTAYYLGGFAEERFFSDFLLSLCEQLHLQPALDTNLPHGVVTMKRIAEDGTEFIFVMNWTREAKSINLPRQMRDYETDRVYQNKLPLGAYGAKILIWNT